MVEMLSSKLPLFILTVLIGCALHLQSLPTKDEAKSSPVNLDQPFSLQCKKYAKSKCVVAIWKRVKSGPQVVRYSVAFRNSLREVMEAGIGYNIGKVKACNSDTYAAISNVELTISYKGTSKTVTAKASEVPTNASGFTAPSTSSSVSNEGIAALVLLFGLIVIFAAYIFLRPRIQHCIRK